MHNEILGERELVLPEPIQKPVKARGKLAETTLIDFSANTSWVVHSEYIYDAIPVSFATSLADSTEPKMREMLRLRPKPGSHSRLYTMDDVLDKYVPFVCNKFKLPYREIQRFTEGRKSTDDSTLEVYDIVEKHLKDVFLECAHLFGLPGLKLGGIGVFYTIKRDDHIHVRDNSGRYLGTVEDHFGDNSTRPITYVAGGTDYLTQIFEGYGEFLYEAVDAFLGFGDWTRNFIGLKPSMKADVLAERTLEGAINVLGKSHARLDWKGERLQIVHRAPSLLYGAYLRVLDRKLGGWSFKVCRRKDCDSVFLPEARNQTYCDPRCANTERVRRYRKGTQRQETGG